MSRLGIIIPCLNEKHQLCERILDIKLRLSQPENSEIVVVDAYPDPESKLVVEELGGIYISTNFARRSRQLNEGALRTGEVNALFFLHIDSTPPIGFDMHIRESMEQGYESGCFRLKFKSESGFLKFFAWFSRFKWPIARGGDQGLFVTPDAFEDVGRFRDDFPFMEDTEICRSLLRRKSFVVRPEFVYTSARKYERVGVVKLQAVFALMHGLYWAGFGMDRVVLVYKRFVR